MKNISINIFLIISLSLLSISSYAQKLNTVYVGYSSDSLSQWNLLEFKNDSILQFRAYTSHKNMHIGGYTGITMSYTKNNNNIYIKKTSFQPQSSSLGIIIPPPSYFLDNDIILKIDDKAIIDENDNRVYVEQNDVEKNKDNIIFVFNGKSYNQGTRKARRIFAREIKLDNAENYRITVYRGLNAYLKYGYDAVLGGVIEIKKKEN